MTTTLHPTDHHTFPPTFQDELLRLCGDDIRSELDRWFPRPPAEPQVEPPPDAGVIEGVERPVQKRYGRRWYEIRRDVAKEKLDNF